MAKKVIVKPLDKRTITTTILFKQNVQYEIKIIIKENNTPRIYWVKTNKYIYYGFDDFKELYALRLHPNNYKHMILCDTKFDYL